MDIGSAPGIDQTIRSLRFQTLLAGEIYMCLLFIASTIFIMISISKKQRTMFGILQIVLLLIVCGAVCAFMACNLMEADAYVISIVVAVIGYILLFAVAFSYKPMSVYRAKKRMREE